MTNILDAYQDGDSLLAWCEHERTWHVHGFDASDPAGSGGDRASHCTCPASPLRSGYVLRYVGPLSDAPREIRDRRPARHHRCDRRAP